MSKKPASNVCQAECPFWVITFCDAGAMSDSALPVRRIFRQLALVTEMGTGRSLLFCPNALVNEAGAIFHLDLLLLGSPRTLAHFLRLFVRHHLFGCGGLH